MVTDQDLMTDVPILLRQLPSVRWTLVLPREGVRRHSCESPSVSLLPWGYTGLVKQEQVRYVQDKI